MAVKTIWPVQYTCGHTENRDLSDKPAGKRASSAKWFGEHLMCSRCFKKQNGSDESDAERDARHAKEAEQIREDAERDGLPIDLVGTEKQVPWALRIRAELIRGAYEALVQEGELSDADFEDQVLVPARPIDRARWWIDNKDADAADLPELLADPGTMDAGASTENVA
ncbi:hypothetical protein [Curtobacterium sp. VKM Ac-2852]|uniref:hypothetical protein n=1 Tax=Curtobacterium sp. VKM Ac-2852 TaxID=2739024 RepID=UPI00156478E8|nr:hypothetical protein [Curtobacterium sp. VKM Ac-2852]NQX25665.1 hypothetical protein [Curtobacterium sp. VKM Ac-2852]